MKSRKVVYCAPGSGLGHLVRACAVSHGLKEIGIESAIVSNSPFCNAVAKYTGCCIVQAPNSKKLREIPKIAAEMNPEVIVLDSFPLGLRGEWSGWRGSGVKFVYVARRLKTGPYLEGIGADWPEGSDFIKNVMAIEPLHPGHEKLCKRFAEKYHSLTGRIALPVMELPESDEEKRLAEVIGAEVRLVVHSGVIEETMSLIAAAKRDIEEHGGGSIAVVTPIVSDKITCETHDFFPASKYFDRAGCVITGAGYNSVAEGTAYARRHIAVAFHRKYDDQQGRLDGPAFAGTGGNLGAAEFIASFV